MVNRKHLSQNVAFGLFRLLSLSVVGILFAILGFIIYKGIGVIDWEFLTTAPANGMTAGGILPAIVGTFCLMVGSALFAFPVGVMSGIYMNEYVPKGWVVRFIRMMTNNLSGIPSIVFGLFGMALFVNYMDFGDGTHPFHLCRLLLATAACKYLRPVHGASLSPLRHLYQRHRYGSAASYCLRHGTGADTHYSPGEPAGERPAEIL